ncbi:MAG: hypothetical protein HFJ05_06940 [Eubacterium sp.]|nr:hypothetical protein [Eubacterium sp.]
MAKKGRISGFSALLAANCAANAQLQADQLPIFVTVLPTASLLQNPPHLKFAYGKGGRIPGFSALLAANCAANAQLQADQLPIFTCKTIIPLVYFPVK